MHLLFGHPVRALYHAAVAVLGQDRLPYVRAGKVVVKDLVHDYRNTFINIPSVDPFVVKSRGRRDGEVVALAAVPLRIDAV